MAIMIPEKPRDFDPASQEGLIFDALALLPEVIMYFILSVSLIQEMVSSAKAKQILFFQSY